MLGEPPPIPLIVPLFAVDIITDWDLSFDTKVYGITCIIDEKTAPKGLTIYFYCSPIVCLYILNEDFFGNKLFIKVYTTFY